MKTELEAISKQRAAWVAAINDGSVDRFVAVLTDDAVWLPYGRAAINGKERVREWLGPAFAAFDYRYSVSDVRVRVAGDWAVERASFHTKAQTKLGDDAPDHEGDYTMLWRKTSSGAWMIERYIDHSGDANATR